MIFFVWSNNYLGLMKLSFLFKGLFCPFSAYYWLIDFSMPWTAFAYNLMHYHGWSWAKFWERKVDYETHLCLESEDEIDHGEVALTIC